VVMILISHILQIGNKPSESLIPNEK